MEIIADRGIDQHVDQENWQGIVNAFIARVKAREIEQGFIECIERCGEILKQHAPATEEKNELPNHMVVIE